jgi:hypothetical protein
MTATTQERLTAWRDNKKFEFPVAAAALLLQGTIACMAASGYATPGITATGLKVLGVVDATADNRLGAAGDVRVKISRGTYKFANSSGADLIGLADVGNSAYLVDNQTVAKTSGGSTRSVAGIIRDVEPDGVWVEF